MTELRNPGRLLVLGAGLALIASMASAQSRALRRVGVFTLDVTPKLVLLRADEVIQ